MRYRTARLPVIAALALAEMLSACSSRGSGDWSMLFTVARRSFIAPDNNVSLEDAQAVPFATIGYQLAGGHEQILVLATDTGSERLWTSGAHVAISTNNGRIVRTAGLPFNLSGSANGEQSQTNWSTAGKRVWIADFSDLGLYGVRVACTSKRVMNESIEILGKTIVTTRVDEACTSDQLAWSFVNQYWVSLETGRVWRSIQHVHPKLDPIELEILRPTEAP